MMETSKVDCPEHFFRVTRDASRALESTPHQTHETASEVIDTYLNHSKSMTPASMMAFFIAGAFACVGNLRCVAGEMCSRDDEKPHACCTVGLASPGE